MIIKRYFAAFLFLISSITGISQDAGFFLNDHSEKHPVIPPFTDVEKTTSPATVTVTVDVEEEIAPVSKYIFGHNANVYMTQMTDQPVLLDHIRSLSPNVIRFPGGNLSSVYFWNRAPNQPPADAPTQILNADGQSINPGYWYGKNNESWTLSVDNYYEMLQQTNSTGIITINYGYARYSTAQDPVASAAHLAADWVRYDNGRTKFWEVGNESNGSWQAGFRIKVSDNKDGQPEIMTGELYGKHFKVFADSMRKAAGETGAEIFIGAQLLQEAPANWWNSTDRNWNTGVFQQAANSPDYYIIHSYYTPYAQNTNAAEILNSASRVTTDMMEYVTESQLAAGVELKPIALTEWNIFAEGSKQQASYINGMHAALVLGSLMKNKYGLAARWDFANGWANGNDHGIFSKGDEPGGVPLWNPRAPYYYMYFFQHYTGDIVVESSVSGSENVEAFATKFSSGEAGIVLVNKSANTMVTKINMNDFGFGERFYTYTLTGGTDNGEFSLKVAVNGVAATHASGGPLNFQAIPAKASLITDGIVVSLPARSVQYMLIEQGDNTIVNVESEIDDEVTVYPTKAGGMVTLKFPAGVFDAFEISDAYGKRLLSENIGQSETSRNVNTPFSKGIYIVRFKGARKTATKKFVVD